MTRDVAAAVRPPRGGQRREGQALSRADVYALAQACVGKYADLVPVLAFTGVRWGELAGLKVGDRVSIPGRGLRVQRAILASRGGGALYEDSVKTHRARTVPLVPELQPLIDRWSANRGPSEWLFAAPEGRSLRESNWKGMVDWTVATAAIGAPKLRVHDLRHTAASMWLGAGADPKVVQRVLGHATATMTLDLYGHLTDSNLWVAASRLEQDGGISGTVPLAGG